jgi:hypothetical protein
MHMAESLASIKWQETVDTAVTRLEEKQVLSPGRTELAGDISPSTGMDESQSRGPSAEREWKLGLYDSAGRGFSGALG